ncbi:hypothetical protein [Runella sp. SP2]|uniref:hypothetical protein n=1 Tax=Runella sp. SP2 TaxID=2268026 RepID=UPI0013DE641A|nr:hypothetical protein [Runella sp. SP2]
MTQSTKSWPKVATYIYLEPATAKYLREHFSEPLEIDYNSLLGSIVNLGVKKTSFKSEKTPRKKKYEHLTEPFKCLLGSWVAFRQGSDVPIEQCFHINRMLLKMMYAELMVYILYHHFITGGSDIQQCIDEFRDRYDIYEKEFPDERTRKMYYRIRRKYGTNVDTYIKFLPAKLLK